MRNCARSSSAGHVIFAIRLFGLEPMRELWYPQTSIFFEVWKRRSPIKDCAWFSVPATSKRRIVVAYAFRFDFIPMSYVEKLGLWSWRVWALGSSAGTAQGGLGIRPTSDCICFEPACQERCGFWWFRFWGNVFLLWRLSDRVRFEIEGNQRILVWR